MEKKTAKICLTITETDPAYGVYALATAAKVLSELQAGRRERDIAVSWRLAPAGCGCGPRLALCGQVEYRAQWQFQAYSDYVRSLICDMIEERKARFCLSVGSCQESGG